MAFIGNQKITVIQRAVGSRGTDGRWDDGAETRTTDVDATVDPMPDELLATLPSGENLGVWMVLITTFEMRAPDEDDGYSGDQIEYEGDTYEVYQVRRYRRVIPHLEVWVRRV